MKGSRPPPCSGFSLTVTDEDQATMFGGLTPLDKYSEAYVLHLPTMVSFLSTSGEVTYRDHFHVSHLKSSFLILFFAFGINFKCWPFFYWPKYGFLL